MIQLIQENLPLFLIFGTVMSVVFIMGLFELKMRGAFNNVQDEQK